MTEDPEPIGAGRVLLEGGIDFAPTSSIPVSGLEGNLWRVPTIGVSVGHQLDRRVSDRRRPYNHLSISIAIRRRLSHLLTVDRDTHARRRGLVIATKIRLLAEAPTAPVVRRSGSRPSCRTRRTRSGLGLDTTDFYASLLGAKTVQSVRVVGNIGFGILADPTVGDRQNDVLTYGVSFARALTNEAEVVGS